MTNPGRPELTPEEGLAFLQFINASTPVATTGPDSFNYWQEQIDIAKIFGYPEKQLLMFEQNLFQTLLNYPLTPRERIRETATGISAFNSLLIKEATDKSVIQRLSMLFPERPINEKLNFFDFLFMQRALILRDRDKINSALYTTEVCDLIDVLAGDLYISRYPFLSNLQRYVQVFDEHVMIPLYTPKQ